MSAGIVIIGAGMAGLACAQALAAAGHNSLILDKGRGLGGRMATRRVTLAAGAGAGAVQFDHGAQYVTAKSPEFAGFLASLPGAAAAWEDGAAHAHYVGLPGMSGLPGAMAAGLDVRRGIEVTGLRREAHGWRVTAGALSFTATRVVLTVPAPQALPLIGAQHPIAASLAAIAMAPCLALMAAFPAGDPRPFVSRASPAHPLAWIAQDSTKPGRRTEVTTWVAQAGPAWSARHLEADPASLATRMLPLLCDEIGANPGAAVYAAAHRWRYARVTAPLGQPFLRSDDASLYLGGDWCLGPRVEAAWQSGRAIADDILAAPTRTGVISRSLR